MRYHKETCKEAKNKSILRLLTQGFICAFIIVSLNNHIVFIKSIILYSKTNNLYRSSSGKVRFNIKYKYSLVTIVCLSGKPGLLPFLLLQYAGMLPPTFGAMIELLRKRTANSRFKRTISFSLVFFLQEINWYS